MLKILSSIIVLVVLISGNLPNLYGQKACDCPQYKELNTPIKTVIYSESRDDNEIKRLSKLLLDAPNDVCKAKGYQFLAEINLMRRQYDSVELNLTKALNFLTKNDCKGRDLYENHRLWSTYYNFKANYKEALDHCFKALEIAENTKNEVPQALFLSKIAVNFIRLQQYDKAYEYSHKAMPLIKKIPPSVEKAILLEDLASTYLVFHQVKINQSYLQKTAGVSRDSSLKAVPLFSFDNILDTVSAFSLEAEHLSKQFGHKRTLLKSLRKLQVVEFWHNNMDKALMYIDSSLMYCQPGIHDSDLFMAYGDKADIYFKLKNSKLASQYVDSCLFYAKKTGVPLSIANAYLTKSDIAEFTGNWKDAFYSLREVKVIMDSVQNIDRTKAVNELEKKYNQAKNEKTIKELDQEKRIYGLLALAALLGIAVFIFYLRQQSLKHKQTIMETEQRLNRARMNPHFFFNALTSLQSFALRENDGKTLASNISKFSHIMRETLESTYKEYITIEQEMDFLNEYLEIQKIRFPKKFTYKIEAADDVEIDEIVIPSMILQPFVENSIEHGFAGLAYEGHVDIFFKKELNEIRIEISDNGAGLSITPKMPNEHISRARGIIKDRIYLLNIKLKTKARFSIDNQIDGSGVLVKIFLPIIPHK
jgi:tetratricopeptide (TPR) repeat protein/anti-sigma regulatory factor (Ser/Thr protein kinase)